MALTGRDRDAYLHSTLLLEGAGVPLSAAVEEYVAARKKLGGEPLADVVEFFMFAHNRGRKLRAVATRVAEVRIYATDTGQPKFRSRTPRRPCSQRGAQLRWQPAHPRRSNRRRAGLGDSLRHRINSGTRIVFRFF
jgi:hypothetical protein